MLFFKPNIPKMLERKDVPGLIGALDHKDWDIRHSAYEALITLGAAAVGPLQAAVADKRKSASFRRDAMFALADIGDAQSMEMLIAALQDHDRDLRQMAAEALGRWGDPRAVGALITALGDYEKVRRPGDFSFSWQINPGDYYSDPYLRVRESIFEALVKIGAPAEGQLMAALQSKSQWVRYFAAKALQEIGSSKAVQPLLEALPHEDDLGAIRESMRAALKRLAGLESLELLLHQLRNAEDIAVRVFVQKYGEGKVDPATIYYRLYSIRRDVIRALDALGWVPQNDELGVSYWCGKKQWDRCVDIGAPAVQPLCSVLWSADPKVRQQAAEALGKIGDARAVEPLVASLQDSEKEVRGAAALALGKIGDPIAVDPLVASLQDSETLVRELAAYALGHIGDPRAIDPLVALMKGEGPGPEPIAAVRALQEIGDKRAAAAVIDCIFENQRVGERTFAGNARARSLFGDYAELIAKAAWGISTQESSHYEPLIGGYTREYVITDLLDAVKSLSEIDTPISSNLLHKVMERPDPKLPHLSPRSRSQMTTVVMWEAEEAAKRALEERGNPPYDPSVYLDEAAWTLSETVGRPGDQHVATATDLAAKEPDKHPSASEDEPAEEPLQECPHRTALDEWVEKLRPAYTMQSEQDLTTALVEMGIDAEEAAIIADAFWQVGYEGCVLVEAGEEGSGYSLRCIDCSSVMDKYSEDEFVAEVERLGQALKLADDPDEKARLCRQRAELTGGLIAIQVNYASDEELQAKKDCLPVHIEVAREILIRNIG